jgi:tetratricopeptide (TPR) repeat protein
MPLSEKEFKIAKAVDPNNLTAREYLSTIFREAGDDEGAAGELEVIESLPACPASSLLDLAELRLRLGRRKEALRALRKAVEKEPGNIKIRLRYEKLLIEEE